MRTLIHWFRRDLRVRDNTALSSAARDAERVVPVFVLDDHYANDPHVGPSRFRFLRESLEALAAELPRVGGRLLLRPGPASRTLPDLLRETGASAVYANSEIGPYPESRDRQTAASLEAAGSRLRLFPDALLVEPGALTSGSGEPYTVYTPFSRKWLSAEKRDREREPAALDTPSLRPALQGVPIERVRTWRDLEADPRAPRGGEREALALVDRFFRGPKAPVRRYAEDRDRPDREGTSRLSPHLHFGTISPRTVLAAARETRDSSRGATRFILELAWREFFHHVLFHFPRVADESFRPEFDRLSWHENPAGFDAWTRGATGFPLVDAAMRELSTTHWMHNRARMVAGSFLTKDLHVHWKRGEAWFEQELADADLANNNGGWQWVAGSGTDAAPYFRIFNPVLQSKKLDPDGTYIRRFVPELARVPAAKIHEPWTMTAEEQRSAGCRVGVDYPERILDHDKERGVALGLRESAKGQTRRN